MVKDRGDARWRRGEAQRCELYHCHTDLRSYMKRANSPCINTDLVSFRVITDLWALPPDEGVGKLL